MRSSAGARASGQALGRTALAGNPSDGYDGAVLAVTIPAFVARAVVSELDSGQLAATVESPALITATVARFEREFDCGGQVIEWQTSIPRSVGLGGSSALVIAILRALCGLHTIALAADVMAELALSIEREDLRIPGGRQDQFTQCYGGLTFMSFSNPPVYERLDPRELPPLVVGWRIATAQPSGIAHADLRARFDAGDSSVHQGMRELTVLGRTARDALLAGDQRDFARCVDASM